MSIKSTLFITLLSLAALSCDTIFCCFRDGIKNKEFTNWGEYEHSGQLRLDGAYMRLSEDSLVNGIHILYSDGLIALGLGCSGQTLDESLETYFDIEISREKKHDWGAFIITGNLLLIQHVHRPAPTFQEHPISEIRGTVLNDTTFELIASRGTQDEEWSVWDSPREYSFIEVDNKPDSNCVLIDLLGAPEVQ